VVVLDPAHYLFARLDFEDPTLEDPTGSGSGNPGDSNSAPATFGGSSGPDSGGSGTFGGGNGPTDDPGSSSDTTNTGSDTGTQPPPAAPAGPIVASTFSDPTQESIRASGQVAQQGLDDAIAQNLADNNKGSLEANGYQREGDDSSQYPIPTFNGNDGSGYLLDPFEIDGNSGDWTIAMVTNNPPVEPILEYAANKNQATLIVKNAYNNKNDANRNENSPNYQPQNLMKLRDMNMDNWRDAVTNPNPKDTSTTTVQGLKNIVINDVVTTDTQTSIDAAFAITGIDPSTMATFHSMATTANELAAYQLIAGTVHGNGIVKMLSDHHVELGNLRVTAFNVFTPKSTPPGYYAIVAQIGN
jgi:hypothetical protein